MEEGKLDNAPSSKRFSLTDFIKSKQKPPNPPLEAPPQTQPEGVLPSGVQASRPNLSQRIVAAKAAKIEAKKRVADTFGPLQPKP